MSNIRPIALQLYTLREAMAADWEGILEKIATVGYAGVETAGFTYASDREAKAKFDQLGLQVVAAHSSFPFGVEPEEVVEVMGILECKRLICASTRLDQCGTVSEIKRQAEIFNEASAAVRSHGLEFGLHNHAYEFDRIEGRLAYDILADDLDESIFFEVDAYWAAAAGVDPVELVARLGDRAPLLHIKDGSTKMGDSMVSVGSGSVDVPAIISAGTSAEWLIVELDACDTDMMTAVTESYSYLTGHGLAKGR